MTKDQKKDQEEAQKEQRASFKRVAREIGVSERDLHNAVLWIIANDVEEPRML